MSMNLKRLLGSASAIGMGILLVACGPDDTTALVGDDMPLASATGPLDWPMDGAGIGFDESGAPLAASFAPLAAAAPMVQRASNSYRYAPDWDYPDDYVSQDYSYASYGPDDGYDSYYDPSPSADNYALLSLAAVLGSVIGNSPPDYYFEHRGVQPWVWMTEDRYVRYAEPISTGYRYYYYEPGRARPFLVRDPYYSYGYRGDRLAVVYDHRGRVLRSKRALRLRNAAAAYYDRGLTLHRVSTRARHRGVAAPLWQDRRNFIFSDQRQWERARKQSARWQSQQRKYEHATARRWKGERIARHYAAERFDNWRRRDYRGAAPRVRQELASNPRFQRAVFTNAAFVKRRNEHQTTTRGLRREDVSRYGLVQRDGQRFAARPQGLVRGPSAYARGAKERGQGLRNRNERHQYAGLITNQQRQAQQAKQRAGLREQRQVRSQQQRQAQQAQQRAGLREQRQVRSQQQRQAQRAKQRAGLREQRQVRQQQQRQAQQAKQRAGLREQRQVRSQQQRRAQQAQQRAGLREQRQVRQQSQRQAQQRSALREQRQARSQVQQRQQRHHLGLRQTSGHDKGRSNR